MGRTTGVLDQQAGLRTRIIYWLVKQRRGRIHLAMRVRAFDPKLLGLAVRMDAHTASEGLLPRKPVSYTHLDVYKRQQ